MNGAEAEKLAQGNAKEIMKSLAALHEPDMVAGGSKSVSGIGNKAVNSSIGSQWAKEGRVPQMDSAARQALEQHGPGAKMNVTLERCK
jgi:type VI secretion system secreted protein VgrG